jgi:hypothetical protein
MKTVMKADGKLFLLTDISYAQYVPFIIITWNKSYLAWNNKTILYTVYL